MVSNCDTYIMLFLIICFTFIHCVVSTPTLKTIEDVRVVGGEDIEITDAPYQVSLVRAGRHTCGGAIVANDIIITAAHCVMNVSPFYYKVRVGSSYSDKGGQLHQVANLTWHPDFNLSNMDSDVAIIKLSKPLVFSKGVDKIEMADADQEIKDGEMSTVTGWGVTKENGVSPRILQIVKIPKINHKACSYSYKFQYNITPKMLCAGIPKGGKDACQGDSGGPLVYENKLSGIVSWGIGCARPYYPGVYAKISALRGWLDSNIVQLQSKYI